MKKLLILLVLLIPIISFSGKTSSKEFRISFINQFKDIAVMEMHKTGIPASITLAQCIHESAWGTSPLAVNANNYFGIKCKDEWQGSTFLHIDDDKNSKGELVPSCFRSYESVEDSFNDHSRFLVERDRYQALFNYDRTDYKAWAKGLKKAGYATDNAYAKKLIKTIEENELYIYDTEEINFPTYENEIIISQNIPTDYRRSSKILVRSLEEKAWAY